MNQELITNLLRYFSRFVPVAVLKETMIQPDLSQFPGYAQIQAEILANPALPVRIPDIEKFILSINEKFVSERIKNSKGVILFVEYAQIEANFKKVNGIKQSIAISVAHNFSDSNHDNLNETILMNRCLHILMTILRQMIEDQGQIDFCPHIDLVTMPVDICVIDPKYFYGCTGWCAFFQNSNTILL